MLANSYKLDEKNLKEIRELRHELKHHLVALKLYLENNDMNGALKYLDDLSLLRENLPVKDYSRDNLFNLILSDYNGKISDKKIDSEFIINVPNELHITDLDLIELFSNLLDNAIEATEKLNNDKKIKLIVKQNGNFLTIQCQNTFDKTQLKRSGQRIMTTKEDTLHHGYGIKRMSKVADKYNGILISKVEDNLFNVYINLCLVPDEEV